MSPTSTQLPCHQQNHAPNCSLHTGQNSALPLGKWKTAAKHLKTHPPFVSILRCYHFSCFNHSFRFQVRFHKLNLFMNHPRFENVFKPAVYEAAPSECAMAKNTFAADSLITELQPSKPVCFSPSLPSPKSLSLLPGWLASTRDNTRRAGTCRLPKYAKCGAPSLSALRNYARHVGSVNKMKTLPCAG